MRLSRTEIRLLEQISKGSRTIDGISESIGKSHSQTYKTAKKLADKKLITSKRGVLEEGRSLHASLLMQLLARYPNLDEILGGCGIDILKETIMPVSVSEIEKKTGLKKSIVYRYVKKALSRSVLAKSDDGYLQNEKIWGLLKQFLEEVRRFEQATDPRIPPSSIIYHKSNDELVFSNKQKLDASKTGFSAFNDYGIKIMLTTNYYCLPKKKLTKKDILQHSLYITEKEKSIRNILFISLFYMKYRIRIDNMILNNINAILKGGKISGYPTFLEIREKAEAYGLKVQK